MAHIKNILITGGAGYIGHVLVKYLLDKTEHKLTIVDSFIYDHSFEFLPTNYSDRIKVINQDALQFISLSSTKTYSDIIILHGLVGDPITNKYLNLANKVNEIEMQLFIKEASKKTNNIIFASTCSNYGIANSKDLANEDFPLNPLSPYSRSKVMIENYILNELKKVSSEIKWTILRFSTAFGLSPRMRFDLTLNEFTKEAYFKKEMIVYDADSWRPYLDTKDISRAIFFTLEADPNLVAQQIFNVGDNRNNITKRGILEILSSLDLGFKVEFEKNGRDSRDYRVDFSKIKNVLGFEASKDIYTGIFDVLEYLEKNEYLRYDELSSLGNYKISGKVTYVP